MGQPLSTPADPPVVEVNYDELTYELLLKEYKQDQLDEHVNFNKPQSILGRVAQDSIGAILLYIGTFVVCDLINMAYTGRWTRLRWMVLGPYNYITGAPLLHNITHIFDNIDDNTSPAVSHCENQYDIASKACWVDDGIFTGFLEKKECQDQVDADYNACIQATPDYRNCIDSVCYSWDSSGRDPQTCEDSNNAYCMTQVNPDHDT